MIGSAAGRTGAGNPAELPLAVEVVACGGDRVHPALRWAADAARRRRLPLEVLVAEDVTAGPPAGRPVLARALTALRTVLPDLALSTRAEPGSTAAVLRVRSLDAALLVVPADLPELDAVAAGAYCPVVVVPDRPLPPGRPVVVGVAPWTTEDTVDLAFAEAAARRVRLIAVRTWTGSTVDLGWLRPDRIAAWDRLERRARDELELALSAARVIHPDVPIELIVAQDDPGALLLDLSTRAQLLVLGHSARGALLDGLVGSPVDALLHAGSCPVMVVPDAGPARAHWLPNRNHGWTLSGRR